MIRKIISPVSLKLLDLYGNDTGNTISASTTTTIPIDYYPALLSFDAYNDDGSLYRMELYENSQPKNRIYDLSSIPTTKQDNTVTVLLLDSDGKPISGTVKFHINPKGSKSIEPETIEVVAPNGIAQCTFDTGLFVSRFEIINEPIPFTGTTQENIPAVLYATDIVDYSTRVFVVQLPDVKLTYTINTDVEYLVVFDHDNDYTEYIGSYKVTDGVFYSDRNLADLTAIAIGKSIEPLSFTIPTTSNIIISPTTRTPVSYLVSSSDPTLSTKGMVIHHILGMIDFISRYENTYDLYGLPTDDVTIKTYGHEDYYGTYGDVTVDPTIDYFSVTVDDGTSPLPGVLVVTDLGSVITNEDGIANIPGVAPSYIELYKTGYDYLAPTPPYTPPYTFTLSESSTSVVSFRFIDEDTRNPIKVKYSIFKISTGESISSGFADGVLVIPGIEANTNYLIQTSSYGYASKSETFVGFDRPNIVLPLRETSVENRGDIILSIFDKSTGMALRDVRFLLSDMDEIYVDEETNEYGTILIPDIKMDKTYNIQVSRNNYGYYEGNLTLPGIGDSGVSLVTIRESAPVLLDQTISIELNRPVISLSLSLSPTYDMNKVPVTVDTSIQMYIPIQWLGPLGEIYNKYYILTEKGTINVPREMEFTLGEPTLDNRGTTSKNYIIIPGTITANGNYTGINIKDDVVNCSGIKTFEYVDKNIKDGLDIHAGKNDEISVNFKVNGFPLHEFSCTLTSDYHLVSPTFSSSGISFNGYLNIPYTITINGPSVYYSGEVIFTSDTCVLDVPVTSLPKCGVTVVMVDNYGEAISNLDVIVSITNAITSDVGGSVAHSTRVIPTNSDGEITFEAPYGSIFEITSSDDTYPIHGVGTTPSKEQATFRINTNGTLHDVYTYVLYESGTSTPIEGANVWITLDAEGKYTIAGPKVTNNLGEAYFTLSSSFGTVYAWASKPGVLDNHVEIWTL